MRAMVAGVMLWCVSMAWSAVMVQDKVQDVYVPADLGDVHIDGVLGERMKVNLEKRLLKVDEAALLGGFQKRPGSHPWIGEHVGKFLHAAANTWAYTHDERLKTLMDRMAAELVKCQMDDGYLGTYTQENRWTSWDVWVHKYNLIGLLRYHEVTGGNEAALNACRRMGDLLCNTFGDGKEGSIQGKDISFAGEHLGMAATSVLEPMVQLYRHTGEKKYLDFCFYITRSMEGRSKVISNLTETKRAYRTANNKCYEMLSNLVGLVELYRVTGDEKYLVPVLNAWEDITSKRLYISGTVSSHEFLQEDFHLAGGDGDDVGEGCVTVTWMQLNLSLLRLKGEAKYADQLERTIFNALLAAQEPETGDICYFTPLNGTKKPGHEINCCLSSEPRGIAMIPLAYCGRLKDGVALNLYVPGKAKVRVGDVDVEVECETKLPGEGGATLRAKSPGGSVAFYRRFAPWGKDTESSGYHKISSPTAVKLEPTVRLADGGISYPKCVAIERGPQVMCVDAARNPEIKYPQFVALAEKEPKLTRSGDAEYRCAGVVATIDPATREIKSEPRELVLVPYADAKQPYVWLAASADVLPRGQAPVTLGGKESQSRQGNMTEGSFTDLRADTMRSTRNNQKLEEDWFAVEMKEPVTIGRVVYRHGTARPDGGWFDTSKAKPRIEYKTTAEGKWEVAGMLEDYPATNEKEDPNILGGQPFEVKLKAPVKAVAVRVIGRPSSGARPRRSFVTCAELQAYER